MCDDEFGGVFTYVFYCPYFTVCALKSTAHWFSIRSGLIGSGVGRSNLEWDFVSS